MGASYGVMGENKRDGKGGGEGGEGGDSHQSYFDNAKMVVKENKENKENKDIKGGKSASGVTFGSNNRGNGNIIDSGNKFKSSPNSEQGPNGGLKSGVGPGGEERRDHPDVPTFTIRNQLNEIWQTVQLRAVWRPMVSRDVH